MRQELLALAEELVGSDGDTRLGVAGRSFQVALMEILDGVDEEEGDDNEDAADNEEDSEEEDEQPLPRLTLRVQSVTGGVGELSMVDGALMHMVDGSRLAQHELALISTAVCQVEQPNPFTRLARVHVSLQSCLVVSYESADISAARHFVTELNAAIAAAPATAPTAASPSAGTSAAPPSTAPSTARPAPAVTAPKPPTKRVQQGRKLREQLLKINDLRKHGHAAEAAELASSLESVAPADAKKLDDLARQRVRQLRNVAFSFGGLGLTREVVQRFCDMPEVRPLLK